MRTIAVIPARYNSSRFKGKPLADLCGRPMIWWVYNQVRRAKGVDEVIVATDDERIRGTCGQYDIPCRMTADTHRTSTERLYEVARKVPAQVYICVNGDEPLIEPALVERVIPASLSGFFAANLMTAVHSPVEVVDDTNIKVVTDRDGYALFMSRSPIPHPKAGMDYVFYKHLGVLAYSLEALCFFAETPKGPVEAIEDINELRFIENGRRLKMIPVEAHTLSVDTPKDLDYVRKVIHDRLQKGEIKL